MPYQLWSQDSFSKGEITPFLYGRATINQYYDGLKVAQNVLTYPTGAAGKRFGTLYLNTLSNTITEADQIYFQTFQYLDECVYQMVFSVGRLDIYLEGMLQATITGMTTTELQIAKFSTTVVGSVMRCACPDTQPFEISRSGNSPATVTSFTINTFTALSAPFAANMIYPVQFSVTGGTILQTVPQITSLVTYFVATTSTTTAVLFRTSIDAKAFLINPTDFSKAIQITGSGTGTTSVIVQNTWASTNTFFKNLPFFDFNGPITSYDAITFTPSATSGPAVTITLSAPYAPLNSSYVGGAFFGNGGSARIIAVADTSHFTVAVKTPFLNMDGILGSLALLAEPAWSTFRGWPEICSSYQSRALYANTKSLRNGFWGSVINDYSNFGNLTNDDDDAISAITSSGNSSAIRFIVPYRSITVHTNTGVFSSPLSDVSPITPNNFTLQLQDVTPADVLQPEAIDNQIIIVSGNDAHTMLWNGINNAYTSNIVSIINEQTIRSPVDETAFADLSRAGSRYVFIVNSNGSMAVYQTLMEENVSGFVPQIMEQSYGHAKFLQVASSNDGRCWFITQREIAQFSSSIAITIILLPPNNTTTIVNSPGSNLSTTNPIAIKFTTIGSLPNSIPQINTTDYFWAVGIDVDNFTVYASIEDARAGSSPIIFTSTGSGTSVSLWPLVTVFLLEQLNQDIKLDCAVHYVGTPVDTVNTGILFNAQEVKMWGDGFGFDAIGVGNQVLFEGHGSTIDVSEAYIGFPINTIMVPMPLTPPPNQMTSLTKPIHIRTVRFMFNNTIGGTINDIPIALKPFDQVNIGEPPLPARGIFEMSLMGGWDDFNQPSFTIKHSEPFDIQLIGVFYSIDI